MKHKLKFSCVDLDEFGFHDVPVVPQGGLIVDGSEFDVKLFDVLDDVGHHVGAFYSLLVC